MRGFLDSVWWAGLSGPLFFVRSLFILTSLPLSSLPLDSSRPGPPTTRSAAIETTVRGLGYALVEVERAAGGLLRVTIDHVHGPDLDRQTAAHIQAGERFINVDDCEKVTRQLQYVLEVEGLPYERLEVSSPGLDRPLKTENDFSRFSGERVDLTLKEALQGRKRFRGVLSRHGDGWRVVLESPVEAAAGRSRKKLAAKAVSVSAPGDDAPGEASRALDFSLDEVRDARLVPTIDFKGRRFAPHDGAAPTERAQDKMDGGLTR